MIYKITKIVFVAVLFASVSTYAQLSGTYTIGGAAPDFATILDARNALNAQGISGPVEFNIRDGVYTEQVLFTSVTGASAVNTITFKSESGNNALVSWEFPANTVLNPNYTVGFAGADYFILSDLTIKRTGINNSARVIDFGGGADYNTITGCILTNEIVSGASAPCAIISSSSNTSDNYNTISNNNILNGSFGFYWYGQSASAFETGNIFTGNTFQDQSFRAVFTYFQDNFTFSSNIITTTSVATNFSGFYAQNCGRIDAFKNKIYCPIGGNGIYFQSVHAASGNAGTVANNFVSVGGTANALGIILSGCSYENIYFNSVNISSTDITNGRAFQIDSTTSNNIAVLNNNFINSGGGFTVYFNAVTNAVVSRMNYNNLYKTAGGSFSHYNAANQATFAAWKTVSQRDTNSVSFDPLYVSVSDLHMPAIVINDFGTPVDSISDDIDGDIRNAFTPDIGADEYSAFAEDVSVLKILSPVNFECVADSSYITVVIKNFGFIDQSSFDIHSEVTGTITNSQVYNYSGTLLAGQTDTITFLNAINTSSGGNITVTVFTTLVSDMYLLNDTVAKSFVLYSIPADPVMIAPVPQPVCANAPVTIDGSVGPGEDIVFYNTPVGGNPIHAGHPWVTSFPATTTVYAEARDTSYVISVDDSLSTFNTGGNGSSANFFDVTNTSTGPITIHYLSTLIAGAQTATVYYLPGGLTSCTVNPVIGNFTLVGSAPVMGLGGVGMPFTFIPVDLNITIPAGQTYAFCISSPSITYTNGTGTGTCPVIASNADISIHEGFGGTTTGPIANRRLNGTVSYTKGGGGCPSNRIPIQIDVIPQPVVNLGNDTTICDNLPLTLSAGTGFVSYLWSDGSTTNTLTVNSSATYWVQVSNGQCSNTDSIDITAISCNAPSAAFSSSDTVFCEKNCLDFNDLSIGATSWNWSFPGASPSSSTVQNPTGICYNSYGIFDITLIACNANGCDTLTLTNFITVVQNPTDSIYFSNDTLYSTPAYSYQWYEVSAGIISGATNQYFIASNPGSYYCLITDSIGCVGTSNILVATGISDGQPNENAFYIFPSPNNGAFEIVLDGNLFSANNECRIIDAYGRLVYNALLNEGTSKINLQVAKGIYFVEIQSQGNLYRDKFMVK